MGEKGKRRSSRQLERDEGVIGVTDDSLGPVNEGGRGRSGSH